MAADGLELELAHKLGQDRIEGRDTGADKMVDRPDVAAAVRCNLMVLNSANKSLRANRNLGSAECDPDKRNSRWKGVD